VRYVEQPGWEPEDYARELALEAEGDLIERLLDGWKGGDELSLAEQVFLLLYAPIEVDTAEDIVHHIDDTIGLTGGSGLGDAAGF
jgi:hypothetical protein